MEQLEYWQTIEDGAGEEEPKKKSKKKRTKRPRKRTKRRKQKKQKTAESSNTAPSVEVTAESAETTEFTTESSCSRLSVIDSSQLFKLFLDIKKAPRRFLYQLFIMDHLGLI